MNQDLKNYIDQAKAAGKSDEVIKLELLGAGWQESDISEVFSARSTTSVVPAAVVAGTRSRVSLKWIVISILALLLAGGGAYFVFASKKVTESPNPVSIANSENKDVQIDKTSQSSNLNVPARCQDLLTDSQFETFTGEKAAAYSVEEKLKNDEYSGTVSCTYKSGQKLALLFSVNWILSNGKFYGNSARSVDGFVQTGISNAKAAGYDTYPNLKVEGVGSMAYFIPGEFMVASTNNRYMIIILSGGFVGELLTAKAGSEDQEKSKTLAQMIDSNLNKY